MADLQSLVDTVLEADSHSTPGSILLDEISDLFIARDRIDAAINERLQVSEVRGVTVIERGRSTRSWLVEELKRSPEDAGRRIRLGWAMVERPVLGAAMRDGSISPEQARVINNTLRKVPPTSVDTVEANMIAAASAADPVALGQLARQIRIMLDADSDAEEAAQRMHDSRWMVANRTYRGMLHVEGMLDADAAAILEAALAPLMNKLGSEDERTAVQRRADAFVELAAMGLEYGDLPDHGGERPQVAVSIQWEELLNKIAPGQVPTATINGNLPISPETARRLACDANLLPVIFNSRSEVLDLGQSTPMWSRAQRRALRLQDQHCTYPLCQVPLSRCQIHHLKYVSQGGPTDKANGAHLCRFHHWLVHHTDWHIWRDADGKVRARRARRA